MSRKQHGLAARHAIAQGGNKVIPVEMVGVGGNLSKEELRARYELAVICQVSDLHGLSDYCGGFAAVRIEGQHAFVLRGHNQHPGQVRVSNSFKCGLDETLLRGKNLDRDAGLVGMVQAIFRELPAVNAIFHGHTPASMVFSTLETELLPISQFGVMYHNKVSGIDFGAIDNPEWCSKLITRLGSNPAVIFDNHGLLTVGRDAKEAYHHLYAIEQAMEIQLRAMSTGAKIRVIPKDLAAHIQLDYWGAAETEDYDGSREWSAWEAMAIRADPELCS